MKNLIHFFVRHPAMVSLGLLLLFLIGAIAFSQVRYTMDPSEAENEIYIDIVYRGASPLEIEERAVSRIEDNLRGIEGLDRFTSVSRENSGRITVEFFESTDLNEALNDVENAVNRIDDFPEEMDPPLVHKQEILNNTISIALTGPLSLHGKKDYARRIRDEFMVSGDISNVSIFGYGNEEIVIALNDEKMERYGITFQEVSDAVSRNNIDMSGGELRTGHANWQIRAINRENTAREVARIPVRASVNGERLLLGDIAEVKETFEERPAARYLNGEESVVLQIRTTDQEDLVAVADYVKDYIDGFNRNHEEVSLTVVDDISEFINERVSSLWENLVMGLILILLIMSLFLDKRIAFWVALTIPLSILGTFVIALFTGYDLTINTVSIFGFILVLGMLVDTGVVAAENIYRHYAEFGNHPVVAARDGAMYVVTPMSISLLTTAVAFSLFFFLPGRPGSFFSEVSFIVIGALLTALVVSFLFLPAKMAGSRVLSDKNRQTRMELWLNRSLILLRDRWFMPFAGLISHRWRWGSVFVFVILLIISIAFIRTGTLPMTFFPYIDDDIQLIEIEMEPGTPVDTTKARLDELQEAVYDVNDQLKSERDDDREVVTNVEQILGPATHQGHLRVVMVSGEIRGISAHEINQKYREAAGEIQGARYVRFLGAMQEDRFGGLPVDISLSGHNMNHLQMAADELRESLQDRTDLVDVADTDYSGNPELHLELTRAGEQLGLSLHDIISQIRTAYFGLEVQNVQRNDEDVRIWLRYDERNRSRFEDLQNLHIRTPQGRFPLREVANIHPVDSRLEIRRTNGQRTIRVDSDLAHPALSAPGILADIEETVLPPIMEKYPGLTYAIEGQNRESMQVIQAMVGVAPILILIMFSLLVINFQSFAQSVLVFLTLPFAFIGVVLGHLIHGVTMNIFSLIGMIALIGVLINNMLVLVTAFNDNLKEGQSFEQALTDAIQSRFRPILLTTLSTVGGLVPMIFLGGLAAAFLQPPAITIAYGLIFGLFISMILAPAFLVIHNEWRLKLVRRFSSAEADAESIEPAVKLIDHQKKTEV